MAYIRKVKTASGAIAVQIAYTKLALVSSDLLKQCDRFGPVS
jgi:hypothetical protein